MKHLILAILSIFLCACGQSDSQQSEETHEVHPGKLLSQSHCASCHILPEPEVLTKQIWKNYILIRMGAFLGIYHDTKRYYDTLPAQWIEPGYGGDRIRQANIYPSSPKLSREEWEQIVDFYTAEAPSQATGVARQHSIYPELPYFQTEAITSIGSFSPYIQALAIDENNGESYVSIYKQGVLHLDQAGTVLGQKAEVSSVTGIELLSDRITFSDMGSRFGIDNPIGEVWTAKNFERLTRNQAVIQLDSLQRPVYAQWADLDQDGREDILVSEFGNYLGHLAWYQQLADGTFSKQILYPDDGSIRTEIHDFNEDGRPDIIALMGNGDEGIDLYLNQGAGKFNRTRVLRFPPSNGSTHFEMVDFNQDGKLDILYCQGDNGDHPPILKSHHGIRLYLNQGDMVFQEVFYLPQNGTYKASAADFDLDGDLDIVSVAYHADFSQHPEEAFVYWEHQGSNQFIAYTLAEYQKGRWAAFDIGDIDQDGDPDILLGAFSAKSVDVPEHLLDSWTQAETGLYLLRNTTK